MPTAEPIRAVSGRRAILPLSLLAGGLTLAGAALAGAAVAVGTPEGAAPAAPVPRRIAPEVFFLHGAEVPGPDGNSVAFLAPGGMVVFDTGRHKEHAQRLVMLARKQHVQVAAIINSHWHLDHVGGNLVLRDAFPRARVFGSDAIQGALRGFLADYKQQLKTALEQSDGHPAEASGWRADLDLIDAGARLAPDEVISAGGERVFAGRTLVIGVEHRAVTATDLWALDPATGVLAVGDLVTLPVPFFDTACPRGWQAALDNLAKQRFSVLVPGHGDPMTAADFAAYRHAFAALLDCADSSLDASDCIAGWFRAGGPQVAAAAGESARDMLDYYVTGILRGDAGKLAKACATASRAPSATAPPFSLKPDGKPP